MTWSWWIPIITRKTETTYTHTMYVHIHDTDMYTHIRKYRARKNFYDEAIPPCYTKQEF